jgi:phage gp36-like protein
MAYSTVEEFALYFGDRESIQVSNMDNPNATTINRVAIESALNVASEEIDGYIRTAGYAVPIVPSPSVLGPKCCDIARYRLDNYRTREEVRQRYMDSVFWLKDVATGKVTLPTVPSTGGGSGVPGDGSSGGLQEKPLCRFYTVDRVFSGKVTFPYRGY